MYRLQVTDHFDAAHHLKDYPGKCKRVHGHRWNVEVCLEGKVLDKMNMLIDFSVVKKELLKPLLEELDHYDINEQLHEENPTAEFIAKWFYDGMLKKLACLGYLNIRIARVTIWESPECCVKYSPDMKAAGED